VRDDAGEVVPISYISVLEFRAHTLSESPEIATLPLGAFVGGAVWLVAFTRDSGAPAT
jgi:hypothetical protein